MLVWYASYGSNLLQDRFMCYINGTRPPGSRLPEVGCTDKTPPQATGSIELPYPLYFAKQTSKWGPGGVAFVCHQPVAQEATIGRMYLITEEQFRQVLAQENQIPDLELDLQAVIRQGSAKISQGWYGKVLHVGEKDSYPIFTFTSNDPIQAASFTTPSSAYLSTIAGGLLDLGWQPDDIVQYFLPKAGLAEQSLKSFIFPSNS